MRRDDPYTKTREGRRQLSRNWREETAYDLSEPKKEPPEEHDNNAEDNYRTPKIEFAIVIYRTTSRVTFFLFAEVTRRRACEWMA